MTLVVLAAGMGSRYKGLKQIDPISRAGEFIIDFSVYDAIRSGFNKVVFIIKRDLYDTFRRTIGRRLERFIEVRYAFQENQFLDGVPVPPERVKPFGTAHALLACLDVVNEPFVVINADDFYGADAYRCVSDYLRSHPNDGKCHFCMAGYVLDNTLSKSGYVSRGECSVDASGYLTGITERTKICEEGDSVQYLDGEEWKPISRDTTVSMNFFGFTPEILTYIRDGFLRFVHDPTTDLAKAEYYLPHAVTQMLRDGLCDIRVLNTTAKWFGVTYPDDKPMVAEEIDKMISSGIYPDGLWK